ncbi:transient receptor potential cation channel subfamily M member-like 2 isoform X2 [Dreissena polymorpha]|uniref:transient receptor potential cation channel subfamily M member-like 2 isoform X2 n=1 Tax=Dreissena polymorpha TaxID=45954 RepID=UPI002264F835|nr:transient receptor potential cation channel subfamily M member-like 2 isoform X2 [Dreissena polymorpha]
MPSDGQDELVKAVRNGEVDNVYAIIRQAYQDFNEFTSASLGVDCNFNFFVIDANGDRRTFTRDDVRKQITGHGKSDDDIPYNFAPGDQVMIRKSGMTKGKVGTVMVACKDSLIIRVCGSSYSYSREDVTLMNRERFNLLKKHFQTHSPVCQGDELQQAVIKDDFEKVTAIIRKAYKDAARICEYQLTTAMDDIQDRVHTERNLDPHHNLFVVVENSTLDEFGGEIEFRANLEKRISSEMIRSRMKGEIYQDRSVLQILPVNLVLNNDQYTFKTVKSATDKGIPSVLVITTDSDTRRRQDSAISDSKNEIKSKMPRNNTSPNDGIKTFEETYQEKLHLCDKFKMLAQMICDVLWDDVSLGSCLLNWVLCDPDRAVVVKRLVCTDDIRKIIMNSDAIAFTMNYFLIRNDVEVIEALLQLDVDMNSAWIDARQYIELCKDVNDGVLNRLKANIKDIPMVSSLLQKVKARPLQGKVNAKAWCRPEIYSSAKQLKTEEVLPYWEYMFIWSLLLRKHDIAKIIWTKTEHPLIMSLIACNLCKAVKQDTYDTVLIVEMENIMSEWSTVAKDCLNECYQISKSDTYYSLKMTMPFWYTQSCLDVAVKSRNIEFLAENACRNLVEDVWNGKPTNVYSALTPKTKFAYNVVSCLVFLILFAYVLLFDLPKTVSTKELVLMTWVLTILVEEIRQMHQTYQMSGYKKVIPCVQRIKILKNYFLEGWNCIDLLTIVMFFLGFGLRFIQFRGTSFDWPRVVLAVDFVVFVVRLVHIFSVQKITGPKLFTIVRMVKDLLYYLVILAVVLLAYAIASYSILYADSPVTWETARQILWKPYWHLYGELFLEDMEDSSDCTNDASLWTNGTSERCPTETGRIVGPFMMGVYLLFSNILLLNTLIAVNSYTFPKIHERSGKKWCFQRYVIVKEYALRPVLCPPVNVFWHIYKLFQWCLHKCTLKPLDDPFHCPYSKSKIGYFKKAQRRYLKREETDSDNSIETANEKLDHLKQNFNFPKHSATNVRSL